MTGARDRWSALLIGIALVVPVAASAGVWQWQASERREAEAARDDDRAALNAATRETLTWASVDFRTADEYVADVKEGATGAFLTQFEESEETLQELLAANRSVQVPTIPEGGAGLLERSGDEATVLIAMDARVSNKSSRRQEESTPSCPSPPWCPRQYRLQVTLVKQGGTWLTSGLEIIDARS